MRSPFERVVDALDASGLEGTATHDGGWMYQCPAHDDDKASLSVGEADNGRALVYCFAGCKVHDILVALNLDWAALFPDKTERVVVAEYQYVLADQRPHIKVLRYEPKGFAQQHWNGGSWEWGLNGVERIPYNLDLITESKPAPVYITEGEKDADTLVAMGQVATTLLGGAGKWRDEYAQYFRDRDVRVVADADDAGRAGAQRIADALAGVAASVRVLAPRTGKDVTDHTRAGFGVQDLVEEGDGLDEFGPLDWDSYSEDLGEWLLEPYVPRGGRVLAFGAAGSLKSLWAMWLASKLASEGGRVAYFSLEMQPSMTAQRLRHLKPPKDRFLCFTKDFKLGSPTHTEKLLRGLRDYDLIVIDSWTAARAGQRDSNEQVSELDTEVLLPLVNVTGATVLIIDNTGHAAITDKGYFKPEHARGASAKGDKMDVTILFERPFEDNNYLTRLTVKKMRYDRPWPKPTLVYTPTAEIEFFFEETGRPMWPGMDILPKPERTPHEEAAEARLRDQFRLVRGE